MFFLLIIFFFNLQAELKFNSDYPYIGGDVQMWQTLPKV